MLARLSAFVIWALVAATAVFWGLRLAVRAPVAPAYAVAVGDAAAMRGDLTRLLGSAPIAPPPTAAAPEAASRFRLLGIVAPKYASTDATVPSNGVALIAVDGKMPRAFAVGTHLDADLVLRSVSLRSASIAGGQGAPAITLELPPLPAAATGTLIAMPTGGVSSMPPTMVPQYVPPPPPSMVQQGIVVPGPGQMMQPPRPEPGAAVQ